MNCDLPIGLLQKTAIYFSSIKMLQKIHLVESEDGTN